MWKILHYVSFLCDEEDTSFAQIAKDLLDILPCPYCVASYRVFYAELGEPRKQGAAEWVYNMHCKVNQKLQLQKLQSAGISSPDKISALFPPVPFLVVRKRNALRLDTPSDIDIANVCLALHMKWDSTPQEAVVTDFTRELRRYLSSPVCTYTLPQVRKFLFDSYYTNSKDYYAIMKAGSCIGNTCS